GHFYLGVSELFLDRGAEAVTALETAQRLAKDDADRRRDVLQEATNAPAGGPQADLQHEAAWYLALAYRRAGQADRAAATLDALCHGESNRAARACAALRELPAPPDENASILRVLREYEQAY